MSTQLTAAPANAASNDATVALSDKAPPEKLRLDLLARFGEVTPKKYSTHPDSVIPAHPEAAQSPAQPVAVTTRMHLKKSPSAEVPSQ